MLFSRGLFELFRVSRVATMLALGILLCVVEPVSATMDASQEAPLWQTIRALHSDDGFADLRWSGSGDHGLYRLTETRDGEERSSLLEGTRVKIYRAIPGSYIFRLQACRKGQDEIPVCGKQSKRLTLEVSEKLLEKALASGEMEASGNTSLAATDAVPGGPDQLRPGLWFNPDREGHGYSFFWANRLSLPESNALHGFSYDLVGYWYTYEAKIATVEGPRSCSSGGSGKKCVWTYSNYRPLAARLKLVRDGDFSYSGGIYVTRNGQEVLEGSATVTFSGDNTNATIDWSVDFKWERHTASDSLVFLAGSQPNETFNDTHYSGIWEPVSSSGITLIDNIGSYSEAIEIIFEDDAGDPAWIQAANQGTASASSTPFCYYYVIDGFPPDSFGSVQTYDSGCDSSNEAKGTNRNGLRYFTGFESARAWVNFTLPSNRGAIQVGSAASPAAFQKTASFHRIYFTLPTGGCSLDGFGNGCPVDLTWFSDGDYPMSSVFLHNLSSGERTAVMKSGGVAVIDHRYLLGEPGEFEFELRMGESDSSSLIAVSSVLTATQTALQPPVGVAISWIDETAGSFRLGWSHPSPNTVTGYEVEEFKPGISSPVIHQVGSGSVLNLDFNYPNGPFGAFSYRIRACTEEICSAWSNAVTWQLKEPDLEGIGIAHPWGDNAAGSGSLIVNIAMDYAMGYHFRPETDGYVKELGGYFNGVKTVKLFERASGRLMAETVVQGDNQWRYAPISPVEVFAGQEYTVAVYLENAGGSYYGSPGLPVAHDGITILGSTYISTATNPHAIPTNQIAAPMYGQADIGFEAADLHPGDGGALPPANPDQPQQPVGKPSFSIDPASASVGSTQGEFSVDHLGAANYHVPLLAAPGSGGLVPDLALHYNSQGPNDIAGPGWSISGLSSIARCPQTREQDGVSISHGVSLDQEDRFCLDGQRLMLISGLYGGDGAEYRTEIDNFLRIRSFGTAGNGPAWFRVWHGDGKFSDYGNSPDSRIEARLDGDGSTVFSWALNRHQDAFGNYIEYQYFENASGPVEAAIERVRYTGNSNAGTSPYAEFRFEYDESRIDVPLSYVNGVAVTRSRLLKRIDSLAKISSYNASPKSLRSWFLDYGKDGFGRAVLQSIEECSDSNKSYCFEPTYFDWLKSEHSISDVSTLTGDIFPRDFKGLNIVDVNGDARPDLLIVKGKSSYSFSVALAQEDGSFQKNPSSWSIPDSGEKDTPVRILVADLNADGFQDVFYPRDSAIGINWVARLSNSWGYGAEILVSSLCCDVQDPRVAAVLDFNGDGLADLLTNRAGSISPGQGDLVLLTNGLDSAGGPGFEPPRPVLVDYPAELFPEDPANGWFLESHIPGFSQVAARSPGSVQAFDYNGDGRVDLLARIDMKYIHCEIDCATTAAVTSSSSGQQLNFQPESGGDEDVNTVSFYMVFESNGLDRFSLAQVVATDAENGCNVPVACDPWRNLPAVRQIQAADVNGDGLADLVFSENNNKWYFRLNRGNGFSDKSVMGSPPDETSSKLGNLVDINGDGFPEFLYPADTGNNAVTWMVSFNDLGSGFAAAESSVIRFGNSLEGDFSLLLDFTGDGMADNLWIDFRNGVVNSKTTAVFSGRNLIDGGSQAFNTISEITTGSGARTVIEYKSLTDPAVYTVRRSAHQADWGRGSQVFDLVTPMHVVSESSVSAPTWLDPYSMLETHYHYAGGKIQAGGRGFLGFEEVVNWNSESKIRTNNRYRQDFPFTGLHADITQSIATGTDALDLLGNGTLPVWGTVNAQTSPPSAGQAKFISYTANGWGSTSTNAASPTWHRTHDAVLERSWSPDGQLLMKRLSSHVSGDYGRIVEARVQTWPDDNAHFALEVKTTNTYEAINDANWILNRIQGVTVEHSRPGLPSVKRTMSFTHSPSTGALLREVSEPGDPDLEVLTEYQADQFGNRVSTVVSATDVPPRTSRIEFDSLGRFPVKEINHFGQVHMQVYAWDQFGSAIRVADIDGVITESASDPMGRIFINWTETGAWDKTIRRNGAGSNCPSDTAYYLVTTSGGKPETLVCLDVLGRAVRKGSQGFDGRLIFNDTWFDALGRPDRISEPYFSGDQPYWSLTAYDELGRVASVDSAAGDDMTVLYGNAASGNCGHSDPRAVLTTNSLGQQRTEIRNVLGETVTIIDSHCGAITYLYDAIGNLLEVTGADGVNVLNEYDRIGRKVATHDPDKGYWRYRWNALGEMLRQLDAKGQALDYQYDSMGRVSRRQESSGVNSLYDTSTSVENSEFTDWQNSISASTSGKGQPIRVSYVVGSNGVVVHQKDFYYDEFGRPDTTVTVIGDKQFEESETYDQFGRSFQSFDASGDFRGVRNIYSPAGFLERVREAREGGDGKVYHTVNAMDARGNVTWAELGNGVEVFAEYDAASGSLLNLSAYDSTGMELQDVDYLFDELGNLARRHDRSTGRDQVEDFFYDNLNRLFKVQFDDAGAGMVKPSLELTYDASGNITWKSDIGSYRYGEGQAGPHAVTYAGGVTYQYDANGNQISGDGRTISYSLFDKAVRIEKAGMTTGFTYGIAHRRVVRNDDNDVDGMKTTYYLGTVEYIEKPEGAVYRRNMAGVAIVDFNVSSSESTSKYLVKDHLGSVHNITREDGLLESATWMSFDAFGQRRAVDWSGLPGNSLLTSLNGLSSRGFTGHEHVDALGLIHMNGRMYDPKLGRFLQADPLVQSPDNAQSLNRYSYAMNNPLSYTDPSGYFFKRFFKRWGRLIAAIVLSVVLPGAGGILTTYFGITGVYVQAAITGFIAGAVGSGTLKGAVIGAIVAVAVTGIVDAYTTAKSAKGLKAPKELMPGDKEMQNLFGGNEPDAGWYRITVEEEGAFVSASRISANSAVNGDVVFTNGVKNGFQAAVKNGTSHIHQAGLLNESYILNFNPTRGFMSDLAEASADIWGAHTGLSHTNLAKDLAQSLHTISNRGITGIQLVGHSQGGAITASALRFASKSGLNLNALSNGGISLHGAPVNAWFARSRLIDYSNVNIASRAQFGDAVHVLGGLNMKNPLEVVVSLVRSPALFSSDISVSPHSLPCAGTTSLVCSY